MIRKDPKTSSKDQEENASPDPREFLQSALVSPANLSPELFFVAAPETSKQRTAAFAAAVTSLI